ncbi:hypothetical protein TNCV_1131301 [Trichonephila clavipes]|nr:hypothetical protein TNCV_1131301 [Trichonephila clavipes]
MLFGRDLRLPADLLFSRPPDAPLAPEEYIEKLSSHLNWNGIPVGIIGMRGMRASSLLKGPVKIVASMCGNPPGSHPGHQD